MRFARKLGLLAVMAIAVMAVTAPSAFAQINGEGDLEIRTEPGGLHCSAITAGTHTVTGGCLVNATSTGSVVLRRHVFGVESTVSTCTTTLTARTNEDAEGYATNQVLAGSCTRRPCSEEAPLRSRPWHGIGHERAYMHGLGLGEQNWTEAVHVDFCIEALDTAHTQENCEVVVPVRAVAGFPHKYEFGIAPTVSEEMPGVGPDGFRCELRGHWTTNGDSSGIEAVHI